VVFIIYLLKAVADVVACRVVAATSVMGASSGTEMERGAGYQNPAAGY
jgi:hypothetical protein